MMHSSLQPKHDIDRPYLSRKEEGRELARIKDDVYVSIEGLENNIYQELVC